MLENRIDRVTIRNYRSLKDVTVELSDLTVLVGLNGSGKSNFLDALQFIADGLKVGLPESISKRGQWQDLAYIGADTFEIELNLTLAGDSAHIHFIFAEHHIKRELYQYRDAFLEVEDQRIIQSSIPPTLALQKRFFTLPLIGGLASFSELFEFLRQLRIYKIVPDAFRLTKRSSEKGLDNDGVNLPNIVHQLPYKWRNELNSSLSTMFPIISNEEGIIIELTDGRSPWLKLKHDDQIFELNQESDGILQGLAILTALYQQPSLPVTMLEEPESWLHPPAIAVLADELMAAAYRSQVIISTHSPDLIARLPADSYRIVEQVNGVTHISPLAPDQWETINDQIFNGGDLLRIEGLKRG